MPAPKFFFTTPITASRSSQKRSFVYMLLLPFELTGNKHVPFYVGATKQLNKRLSNHKEVNWFTERFNTPVPVFIVGTVPDFNVLEASLDLGRTLIKQGYWLAAHKSRTVPYVKTAPDVVLRKNAQKFEDITPLVEAWVARWEGKTMVPQPVLENPVKGASVKDVTKKDLTFYCENMNFGSFDEKNLIVNIAHAYSETNQCAVYSLSVLEAGWVKRNPKSKLNKFYRFPSNPQAGKPTYFYLQQSLINRIANTTDT